MNDYGELVTKRVRRVPAPSTVDLTGLPAPTSSIVDLTVPNPNPNPNPNTSTVRISSVLSIDEIVDRKFLDAEQKGLMINLE